MNGVSGLGREGQLVRMMSQDGLFFLSHLVPSPHIPAQRLILSSTRKGNVNNVGKGETFFYRLSIKAGLWGYAVGEVQPFPFHGLMCNLSPFLNVNFFYLSVTLSPCLVSLVTVPVPWQTCHQLSHLCSTLTDRAFDTFVSSPRGLTRARPSKSTIHAPNRPHPKASS